MKNFKWRLLTEDISFPPMIDDEKIFEIIDEPSSNLAFRFLVNRRNVGKFDNDANQLAFVELLKRRTNESYRSYRSSSKIGFEGYIKFPSSSHYLVTRFPSLRVWRFLRNREDRRTFRSDDRSMRARFILKYRQKLASSSEHEAGQLIGNGGYRFWKKIIEECRRAGA